MEERDRAQVETRRRGRVKGTHLQDGTREAETQEENKRTREENKRMTAMRALMMMMVATAVVSAVKPPHILFVLVSPPQKVS